MRMFYRILAYILAAEVVVQAGAMALAIAGLGTWVDDGGVFDSAVMQSDDMLCLLLTFVGGTSWSAAQG